MPKGFARQIAIVLATLVMLFCNLVLGANAFSEGGAEQSVYYLYPTAFSPAPFTFAVWLPIFAGTLALAIYQARPSRRNDALLDRMAGPYLVALGANTAQVFTPLGWSNLAVLALFLSLAMTFAVLVQTRTGAPRGPRETAGMRWCVRVPVALFATWAGLATIVNACQLAVASGIEVGTVAAAALVALAMGAGAYAIWRTREWAILAVMLWAGAGIWAANAHAPVLVATILVTSAISIATMWRATESTRAREPAAR